MSIDPACVRAAPGPVTIRAILEEAFGNVAVASNLVDSLFNATIREVKPTPPQDEPSNMNIIMLAESLLRETSGVAERLEELVKSIG